MDESIFVQYKACKFGPRKSQCAILTDNFSQVQIVHLDMWKLRTKAKAIKGKISGLQQKMDEPCPTCQFRCLENEVGHFNSSNGKHFTCFLGWTEVLAKNFISGMIVHQTLIHRVLKLKLSLGEGQIEVSRLSFETNRAP